MAGLKKKNKRKIAHNKTPAHKTWNSTLFCTQSSVRTISRSACMFFCGWNQVCTRFYTRKRLVDQAQDGVILILTTQDQTWLHYSLASSGFWLVALIPQEDVQGMLGESCWQEDEPTSQLVRPAAVTATAPGPNHTLLWVNCASVSCRCKFVCVYVCILPVEMHGRFCHRVAA